jgi:uncharacterized protein (DUF1800 family)
MSAEAALTFLLNLQSRQLDQPVYDDPATPNVENLTWCLPIGTTFPAQDFVLRQYVIGWWINEALRDVGIGHKMAFFFHQYLTTTANTASNANFYDYLELLRWGALGNFKKLVEKMITDNTMLRYLNNNENTKGNPNENFAREFFELFTIGKGPQVAPGDYTHYTEEDIVAAARVFTGFRSVNNRSIIDPETGFPTGVAQIAQHDTGNKTFSAKFQQSVIIGGTNVAGMRNELTQIVDMVFRQKETAKTLCRRLYRYFVHRNISAEIESDIIGPLADTLLANNFEMKPVLTRLLSSVHFFDMDDSDNADEIVGGMIKSPLELCLQTLSFFQVPIPNPNTANRAHYQLFYGQTINTRLFGGANFPIFFPSDVAGYPPYHQHPDYSRQWFNSSSIIARYKMPAIFLSGTTQIGANPNNPIGTKLNIAPWVRSSGVISDPKSANVVVEDLVNYLLPEGIDPARFDYFYQATFLDGLPPADWTYEWENYLNTNNPTEVTIALERLVTAILYSPEYQTF